MSRTNESVALAGVPAAFCVLAATVYVPSKPSSVAGVNDQSPLLSATAEPDATTLLFASVITTATVRPASVLPVMTGVASLVKIKSSTESVGAAVSTVKVCESDGALVLPASSVATAETS